MKTVKQLQHLQSDTYILMLKTHNFHWNVRGPFFSQLHLLFEGQYTELFQAVDLIAERLRSLDAEALGQYESFQKMSKIKDSRELEYKAMIKELIQSNEEVVKTAQGLIKTAEKEDDEATADLAIERVTLHQKNIWMLKALLEK